MITANRLLNYIDNDQNLITPYIRKVALRSGQVLWDPGDTIHSVYFLEEGAVSKLVVFADGSEIESSLVGREGAIGAMAAFGLERSITRDVCHVPAQAYAIDAARLRDAVSLSSRVREAIHRYNLWKMTCSVMNGACNARHTIEQRLAKWLLICACVLDTSEVRMPQDVFAKMLGVQRTSINAVLRSFRTAGLIDLGRSRLIIVDPEGLEARACECYRDLAEQQRAILRYS